MPQRSPRPWPRQAQKSRAEARPTISTKSLVGRASARQNGRGAWAIMGEGEGATPATKPLTPTLSQREGEGERAEPSVKRTCVAYELLCPLVAGLWNRFRAEPTLNHSS